MMADVARLQEALRAADKAGDTAAATRFAEQIRASSAQPADDGKSPVPVEDNTPPWQKWASDTYHSWVPPDDPWAAPRSLGEGVVKGVYKDLPNAVPNTMNEIHALNDLWFGSGKGDVAPQDQWQPWTSGTVPFTGGKTIDEVMPVKPGWEGVENTGRIAGVALPATVAAIAGGAEVLPALMASSVVLPATIKGGEYVGHGIDVLTGNLDTNKYERTLGDLAPLATGTVRTLRGVPAVADTAAAVNRGIVKPVVRTAQVAGALTDPVSTTGASLLYGTSKLGADKLTGGSRGFGPDINRTITDTGTALRRNR